MFGLDQVALAEQRRRLEQGRRTRERLPQANEQLLALVRTEIDDLAALIDEAEPRVGIGPEVSDRMKNLEARVARLEAKDAAKTEG